MLQQLRLASAIMLLAPSAPVVQPIPPALLAANPKVTWDAASRIEVDFDRDGRPDLAFLGRASGRIFVAVLRASSPKPEILDFAIGADIQAAICGEPAVLSTESQDYDPAETLGHFLDSIVQQNTWAFGFLAATAIASTFIGTTSISTSTGEGHDHQAV